MANTTTTTRITTSDGVGLHVEDTGSGTPIVFVHEFADDLRGWEDQVRHFSRRYRCVTYNARGYPPSDVPEDWERYSQERARDDIRDVMKGLGIDRAYVVGNSMGGFASLHFAMDYPELCLGAVVAGCGYGAQPDKQEEFRQQTEATIAQIRTLGMEEVAKNYSRGPTRIQHLNKDPRSYAEFARRLAEHSTLGSANTMQGVQNRRPSLWQLADKMRATTTPILVVTGDEDDPCLDPGVMMKRLIPSAWLLVLPHAGHNLNIEDPAIFNRFCEDFFHTIETGRWKPRDARAAVGGLIVAKD